MTLSEYVLKGLYIIMRKCPTAYKMFGHTSIWDMTTTQFNWVMENLADEFKPQPKKKGK